MKEKQASKRILPRRPGKKMPVRPVTRDEISQAIHSFKKSGGLIRLLPAEVAERSARVGHRWDTMYEMPMERL